MTENILLQPFNPIRAEIEKMKAHNLEVKFDYEKPEGNKAARSHVFTLRKVKSRIADAHKTAKADALNMCNILDGLKRDLTSEVEGMIAVHEKPLLEIEDREARKIAEEKARIEADRIAEENRKLEEIRQREAEIAKRESAIKEAEERAKAEAQRIEDEKRKAEREAQMIKDAEERAKRETKEAEEKRVNNQKHRAKINNGILSAFVSAGCTEEVAKHLITLIAKGEIDHVAINY